MVWCRCFSGPEPRWFFHLLCWGLWADCISSCSHLSTAQHRFLSIPELIHRRPVGLGSTYGIAIRRTPLLSAPCTGLNWEGTIWAGGKDSPAQFSPHSDTTQCCPAVVGPSVQHPRLWRALMRSLSLGGKHRPSHVIIPRLWSFFISYRG